jgi:nucleotide-binding universal stress UspA family protein
MSPAQRITKKIVVGVDGSATSADALAWSVGLSERLGFGVIAMTAWEPKRRRLFHGREPDPSPEETEQRLLDELDKFVADTGVGTVEREARCGPTWDVLCEAANRPEVPLIVVGTRGLGTISGLLLGSVSRRLLFGSPRPVALIPHGDRVPRSAFDSVVIAIDGSSCSAGVAEWGARLCSDLDVTAIVLQCIDAGSEIPPGWLDEAVSEAAGALEERWSGPFRDWDVPYRMVVRNVDPRTGIVATADEEGAGMIVVAARGAGQFDGLGGTASYLARHSPVPVAVVPPSCPEPITEE